MELSNEERELLYQEFKRRMNREGNPIGRRALAAQNFSPAFEHFRHTYYKDSPDPYNKIIAWAEPYKYGGHGKYLGLTWDDVRMFVCHVYGFKSPADIPEDKLEEANDLAIHIIDECHEVSNKFLEGLPSIK